MDNIANNISGNEEDQKVSNEGKQASPSQPSSQPTSGQTQTSSVSPTPVKLKPMPPKEIPAQEQLKQRRTNYCKSQ